MVGEVARRFRKTLMAEHLGVLTKESRERLEWDYALHDDPVCDKFFHDVWCKISNTNMELFEQVRGVYAVKNALKYAPQFQPITMWLYSYWSKLMLRPLIGLTRGESGQSVYAF